jgi:hypothetical protein
MEERHTILLAAIQQIPPFARNDKIQKRHVE